MGNKLSFKAKISLLIYRTLHLSFLISALSVAPFLGKFSRRVKEGFNDYFGNVKMPAKETKPVFWIHAVSMGESMVALGFVKVLKETYPNCSIVFTTTHPDVIKDVKKKNIADAVAYFPLDNYRAMNKIINKWSPDAVFVAETDFWPEFSYQCKKRNIPLILFNGRISNKIANFYKQAKGFAELVFNSFSFFAVQSKTDAEKLLDIGVPADKIEILGNMKADLTHTNQVNLANVSEWINQRKTVVFGSLHPDEFCQLKDLFKKLSEDKIAVIIAPRNINFSQKWKSELNKMGLNTCCKTNLEKSDVMLLDTIGELASVYKLSNISFVGGSLDYNKTGGHNPLEVLQQNVPLIMGAYYRNFNDIVEQLKAEGGISIINNVEQAYKVITQILSDETTANNMILSGHRVLESNKGAVIKTLNLVKKYI